MAEKKGKLVQIKTKETTESVEEYINNVAEAQKRADSHVLLEIMRKATGEEPRMWGASIIGFGNKRYKSPATGREVDWFVTGFSPRKANLTVYLIDMGRHADALGRLGKHKTGGGCLYINKLADVDIDVLGEMIEAAARMHQ